MRDNLQNEKIIHAMHHHYGHHNGHHYDDYYGHYGHHGHHRRHHHGRWDDYDGPQVVYDYRNNYNNNDRDRRGNSPRRGGGD